MKFHKKNLAIILVILYLIIYYCNKYWSNTNQELIVESSDSIEKAQTQTQNQTQNQAQNQNQTQNQAQELEQVLLENNIEYTKTNNEDILVQSIEHTQQDKNIQQLSIIPNSITKTNICDTIKQIYPINADGSELVNYNYVPKIVEGFENLNSDKIKEKYSPIKTPRYIWVYWENINRINYPTHIKLCLDTIKRHLGTKYKLVILNEKSISQYLPDLRDDFLNLKVAQKVDYYRIALLYKYGGIWLDADIIVMKDLDPIFKKLDEGYDYVGFGCTGSQCSNGKFKPSNWVLGARPQSVLMELVLSKLDAKLDSRDSNIEQNEKTYHDYGKMVIWEALDDLKPQRYDYYHFTSEYDGTRDSNKYWVYIPNFFKTDPTKLLDESKVLFVVFYNSEITPRPDLHWIRDCAESELLYSKLWLGELYRKALGII